jgi:hypothetical protein
VERRDRPRDAAGLPTDASARVDPARRGSTPGGSAPSVGAPGRAPAEELPEDLAALEPEPDAEADDQVAGEDADPNSDRTAPALDALGFDPPQVEDGSAVTLWIAARDDLSGVKSARGFVTSPRGAARLPFGVQSDAGGPLWVKITIPKAAETGAWYVSEIYLLDRADNAANLSFTPATVPPGGVLRVVSSESDADAPEVLRVWVENPAPRGGERTPVVVEVRDEGSGVASVRGAFQNRAKTAMLWFDSRFDPAASTWRGDLVIPPEADCGEWNLWQLRAVDVAGNTGVLWPGAPQLKGVTLLVSGDACDSEPPTLEAVVLTPAVVSNETGGEVQVLATVRDVGSGAVSLHGWVSGPMGSNGQRPRIAFSCIRDPRDPELPWSGKITVPRFAARGTWFMSTVRVADRALNYRDLRPEDPVLAAATFEVE